MTIDGLDMAVLGVWFRSIKHKDGKEEWLNEALDTSAGLLRFRTGSVCDVLIEGVRCLSESTLLVISCGH